MAFAPLGQIEVVDPSTVTLSGYATITGVEFAYADPYQQRVRMMRFEPGAFANWLKRNDGAPLPVHWQHGLDKFQIAETTDVHEDARGLSYTARPIATSQGIDACTAMAGRERTAASLVFDFGNPIEDRFGVEHIVDVVRVAELGPSSSGVNPHAFSKLTERSDSSEEPEASTDTSAALAAEIYRALAHLRSI